MSNAIKDMKFDILITTFGKTEEEILSFLKFNNIHGSIYVGNQKSNVYSKKIIDLGTDIIRIYNLTNSGVSKNRNFLLMKATSDYVIFLDDDIKIIDYKINIDFDGTIAYRFNVSSNNPNRPIKDINSNKFLKFVDVKSYGVWGIFFPREFLIKNNVFFNEYIGPGCLINHGEDSLFLHDFLDCGKIYQVSRELFIAEQKESTWRGKNRNLELELISHGFVFGIMFGVKSYLFLTYSLIKNKNEYLNINLLNRLKFAFFGYKLSKKASNGIDIDDINYLINLKLDS